MAAARVGRRRRWESCCEVQRQGCKVEVGELAHVGGSRLPKQARKLAAETYGAHEANGEWDDDGEWHLVNDGDFDSSEDEGGGLGSGSDSDGSFGGFGELDDDGGYSSFSGAEFCLAVHL